MKKFINDAPILKLENIKKSFGENHVLKGVDFSLHKGEVHALLGENGAGKTTLMNILFGLFPPNEGIITIGDKTYKKMTPKIAMESGIGMVHQHFMLIDPFTVAENIILGSEITKGLKLDQKKAVDEVIKLSEKYGLVIDPNAKIEDITVGMGQRVEILKALYRGADILIFDEPTAVLTPQEIEDFTKIVKNLTLLDKSVIIITHKLSEIKAMADTCTIIRRGEFIEKVDVEKVDENELAEKMVGRNVSFNVDKEDKESGEIVLEIKNLVVKDKRGLDSVKNLNLTLKKGEILGIAGVDGNGQTELIDAITGFKKVSSGEIILNGENIENKSTKYIIEKGIDCIPEDRHKRGLVLDYSVENNLVLKNISTKEFSKNGIINFKNVDKHARKLIEDFDVRPQNPKAKASDLSGGNQQKVIIAREVSNNPDVLIAAQPTRGLDVGAIEFIHQYLVKQRNNNKAVLLISFELDEVMDLSDRIAVIFDGKIVGEKDPKHTNQMEIGRLMAGGQ